MAAVNVPGDHTITLLADNAEEFAFAQVAEANITVDGAGNTFTGKITLNAGAGNLTFTDMTLTPSNADAKSIVLNASTAPNVTIDGCTMQNTGTNGAIVWGLASATSNKVVIKNSTASHLQYLVGTNQSGCKDVTVESVTATDMAYLVRSMKATSVYVKDVTYSGLTFIQVKNSNVCTLVIEDVTVTTTQAGMPPVTMLKPDSGNGAKYTIILKGENTANGVEMTPKNESAWFATEKAGLPYEIIQKLDSYTIIDGSYTEFVNESDIEVGTLTYKRNFRNTNWQTIYLPFAVPYANIEADFEVAYIYDTRQYDNDGDGFKDETVIESMIMKGGELKANYPYLIRAKEAGEKSIVVEGATLCALEEISIDCSSVFEKYTFTGSYTLLRRGELPNGGDDCYLLGGGQWKPLADDATVNPFRFYLFVESREESSSSSAHGIRMRVIGEESEDGSTIIYDVEMDREGVDYIYDLQGRRVLEPQKGGLYIINGKKVVF